MKVKQDEESLHNSSSHRGIKYEILEIFVMCMKNIIKQLQKNVTGFSAFTALIYLPQEISICYFFSCFNISKFCLRLINNESFKLYKTFLFYIKCLPEYDIFQNVPYILVN